MNADGSNIRNITDTTTEDFRPQWSPNGKKIVFYSTRDGGDRDIIVMNADGSKVRQLTKNDVFRDFLPRWSPNGEQIVFDSNRDGKRNIYLMDVNSKKVKQLTSHPKADIHPAWSPNGKEILFSSNRSGSFKTYVMSSEGEDVRKIAEHVAIQPHWSANGR